MRRFPWTSPWTPYVLMLLSAMPLGAVLARANPQPPDACSGIGFGCSLYGWDAVGFFAMLFGAPYATVLGIAILLLSLLPKAYAWLPLTVGWLGLGGFLMGVAFLANSMR